MNLTEQATHLSGLWDDEYCTWELHFEAPWAGNDPTWRLDLEWRQESFNQHQADWTQFTWQFYGDTAAACLGEAIGWCESLEPLRRCSGCDGDGEYGPADARITCEDCKGSGLASDVTTSDPF